MIVILDNIVPVFSLMLLGWAARRFKLIDPLFFKVSDRLVYFLFFPVMLFWKIGGSESGPAINWPMQSTVIISVFTAFLASLIAARLWRMPDYWVGSFSQCAFRFNTFVGMAVVLSFMGEDGVRDFGLIISLIIPFINVLSVWVVIWHSEKSYTGRTRIKLVLKAMLVNPLIIACLAGLVYASTHLGFPAALHNSFRLLSAAALPLALLSIGSSLTLGGMKDYLVPSLLSSAIKLILLPAAGYVLLTLFGLEGDQFKVALIYCCLPTSSSAFILSSQLGSDPALASAAVVVSTVLSFFSLSLAVLI